MVTVARSPYDPSREKPGDSAATEDFLVVNQLTWPELARQCIVANVRRRRGGMRPTGEEG